MEFMKKNWTKITAAVLLLAGAIFFIVILAKYNETFHNFAEMDGTQIVDNKGASSYLFGYIAALTFFVLGTAFVVMSMFDKTKPYGKWVLCTLGVLCLTFMLVSIVQALGSESSRYAREIMAGNYNEAIKEQVANAIPGFGGTNPPIAVWPAEAVAVLDAKIQAAKDLASYQYFSRIVALVSQAILYGLLPLAYAAKKFFKKNDKKIA